MNGRCFEDCYWYYEEKDMGARIPFCKLRKGLIPVSIEDCANCDDYHTKYKKTKADRIRAMSDEELADMFAEASVKTIEALMDAFKITDYEYNKDGFARSWMDWLRSEADD